MSGLMQVAILVLATLAFSNANAQWKQFVPDGKEVIYEYKALVKAGTHIPHEFASEFMLNGKLHLHVGSEHELWVRLDDLKYEIDNGREDEERKSAMQTSTLEHVTKPFKIIYEGSGIIKEIVTEEKEPEYALNMKKAIATMLQMNVEKIPLDCVKPFSFSSKEKSLFGTDDTLYSVMPTSDTIKINRMHYMHSTSRIYNNLITDFTVSGCDAAYEEPVSYDTQKYYIIDRKDPHQYKLKYMGSNGGVYFQPSQAQSLAFYVYVNQTFHMIETIDKKTPMSISKEAKHTSLEYILNENSLVMEKISDTSTLIPVIEDMVHKFVEYMKEDKIKPTEANMGKGQYINRMIRVLWHFDETMLKELYTKCTAKATDLEVLQQILPMVGSRASLKFIITLVLENKVNERLSIDMLQKMAFYVRIPTVEMITELEKMLEMKSVPLSVQKIAILSFGTLLNKLHSFNLRQHIQTTDVFKRYIEQLVNKLKTSKKIEEQYLYLDTLFNMHNDLVAKYLEPIVKGEWFNDNRLRYKSMLAVSSVVLKHDYHDKMFELYWPIMIDTTLPTHMRIMAFYLIMKSQPSLSCQINVYAFMQHEKDVDFLNFYHTYLRSLMESKNPCLYKMKIRAKQILLYWPLSYKHSLTQFHTIDMTNWKYNYGLTYDFGFINTKEAMVFLWKMEMNIMNLQANPNTLYVKVTGMDRRLLDDFYLHTKKGMEYMNFDALSHMTKFDDVEIEVIHIRHGQVIETCFYNKNNMKEMSNYFKVFSMTHFTENTKTLDIHFDMMVKMFIPTDIGFPVLLELLMPSIHETESALSKQDTNKITNINIDNKYRMMNYYSFGLSFYNPFATVWQGITKYMYLETQLPIFLEISLNPQQSSLKLTWKRHQEADDDVIGFRSYAVTYVYVHDNFKKSMLQKCTPTAKNYVRVSHSDKYKHDVTMIDTEEYNIGYKYILRVFKDETPKYYLRFPKFQDFLFNMEPWSEKLMKLFLYMRYIHLQHDMTERGIMFRLEPSVTNPVTSTELTIKYNDEITEDSYGLYQPAMKINARVTYAVMKNDKALKTWDMNAIWDLNKEHTTNSLKLDISRIIPGKNQYKICIQGTEQYHDANLTGRMTVNMGESADGKCNKEETTIDFNMQAEQLPEQKQRLNNYAMCHHPVMPLIEHMRPYSCYMDRSSLRYYTVDVNVAHFPTEFKNIAMNYWRMFLAKYYDHYLHLDEKLHDTTAHNLRIQFRYPVSKDVIDMRFITPTETHSFKSLSAKDFAKFGIYPDNLYYSNLIYMLHKFGLTNICVVDRMDLITVHGDRLSNVITNEWTSLMTDAHDNTKRALWAKLVGDKIAIKTVFESKTLEMVPKNEGYTVTLNGKELDHVDDVYLEHLMISKMEDSNTLVVFSKTTGGHMIYNGHQFVYETPKTDFKFTGKCLDMKQHK